MAAGSATVRTCEHHSMAGLVRGAASILLHTVRDVCVQILTDRTVLEGELPGPRPGRSSEPRATWGPCSSAEWQKSLQGKGVHSRPRGQRQERN